MSDISVAQLPYGRKLTSDEIKADLIKAWLNNANFGVLKIYVDLNECEFIKFIKFSELTTNNYFDCSILRLLQVNVIKFD